MFSVGHSKKGQEISGQSELTNPMKEKTNPAFDFDDEDQEYTEADRLKYETLRAELWGPNAQH